MLKSHIDWNEIVPKLPKQKRDDLYLEAVALLSAEEPEPRYKKPRSSGEGNGVLRVWHGVSPGERLARHDRKYHIHKDARKHRPHHGKIAKLWAQLRDCNADDISFAGLTSLAKDVGLSGSMAVSYLWSRALIDVVEAKQG